MAGDTLLTGAVDQAALHGLLKKVRDLGIPLVSVILLGPDSAGVELGTAPKANDSNGGV